MKNKRDDGINFQSILPDIRDNKIDEIKASLTKGTFPIFDAQWIKMFLLSGDLDPMLFAKIEIPTLEDSALTLLLSNDNHGLYELGITPAQLIELEPSAIIRLHENTILIKHGFPVEPLLSLSNLAIGQLKWNVESLLRKHPNLEEHITDNLDMTRSLYDTFMRYTTMYKDHPKHWLSKETNEQYASEYRDTAHLIDDIMRSQQVMMHNTLTNPLDYTPEDEMPYVG